jgi:hypothetical protein
VSLARKVLQGPGTGSPTITASSRSKQNNFTRGKTIMKTPLTSLAVLGLASCASAPMPAAELQRSEASIRGAEELGALGVPAARLRLEMAKDPGERGKQMAADGDKRAVLVLARAESDAELAMDIAREVAVHTSALKATEDLKAVRARGNP